MSFTNGARFEQTLSRETVHCHVLEKVPWAAVAGSKMFGRPMLNALPFKDEWTRVAPFCWDHAQLHASFAGYSVEEGTVLLDISGLDSLRMLDDSHAAIGAGIKLGPLYLGLHQNGSRAFPAGVCPAVGAGGHLTGEQFPPAVLAIFACWSLSCSWSRVSRHG